MVCLSLTFRSMSLTVSSTSAHSLLQGMRKYVQHGFFPRSSFPPRFAEFLFFCFAVTRKVFIAEITARAFIVADSNKRRTLSRADITKALSKSDQFDFLIDIVPRDEPFVPGVSGPGKNAKKAVPGAVSVRVRVMLPWLPGMSFDEFDSLHPHRRQPHKKHRVTHRGTPLSMAEIVLTWMACPTPAC